MGPQEKLQNGAISWEHKKVNFYPSSTSTKITSHNFPVLALTRNKVKGSITAIECYSTLKLITFRPY